MAVVIATLLFPVPGILSAVVGLLLERVATAVERRHYPNLPAAALTAWRDAAFVALRLGGLTALLNLLLLPLYLLFIFILPLSFALYYAVNGKLQGRESFEIIALRRNNGAIWRTGAVTAGPLTIPGLNLVAPVIGTAAMVHVFQKLTRVP
jgi:CysZ protein